MARRVHRATTIGAQIQGDEGSLVGKIRALPAGNRRMRCVHPKDSDLVVDSLKFRVI
jgi:hypothetical protein